LSSRRGRQGIRVANDLGLSGDKFLDFSQGRIDLPSETLHKMTAYFFPDGGRKLDVERDLFVLVERPNALPGYCISREPVARGPRFKPGTAARTAPAVPGEVRPVGKLPGFA
jgi:hypothetical protein